MSIVAPASAMRAESSITTVADPIRTRSGRGTTAVGTTQEPWPKLMNADGGGGTRSVGARSAGPPLGQQVAETSAEPPTPERAPRRRACAGESADPSPECSRLWFDAGMPRVACLTLDPPDRSLGGGNIRQAYLLSALGARAETHLIVAGHLDDEETRSAMASVRELRLPPVNRPQQPWKRRALDLQAALTAKSQPRLEIGAVGPARPSARPSPLCSRLTSCSSSTSVLSPLISLRQDGRWGLTLHNIPSLTAAQTEAVTTGARQKWLWRRERQKCLDFESWLVSTFDVVFTVSAEDAAVLPRPTVVVPNGVDTDRILPTAIPAAPRLVFTGTLGFAPNVDGLVWFCSTVLPLIKTEIPDVVLDLVGRSPVPEVLPLRSAGVNVHTDVPSIQPYIDAARVAIVPLRLGSGTRLKALEAKAAGRPVVGTAIGLAGLGLVPGQDALFADSPTDMAAAIVSLLRDDARCVDLAAHGLEVAHRHAW